jgi:hypothetical protein
MDIFVTNVPPHVNHAQLRRFLRNTLQQFDILAFDILKVAKKNWAILTTADPTNAQRFLRTYGGFSPIISLRFEGAQLGFKKSAKGQPDALKIRVLMEKEAETRAKQSRQPPVLKTPSSKPIFPYTSVQTGVWGYDDQEKLFFDSKHQDQRRGAITIGRSVLVVYLAAEEHREPYWHCRIDIPYSIIEHAIPSEDNNLSGTITLTLRSPPKIYKIEDTDDLHLYTGTNPTVDRLISALRGLKLGPKTQRLTRETSIMPHLHKNSALCMVYRFNLPDIISAQRAWMGISKLSALSREQAWKSTVPSRISLPIETEYQAMEKALKLNDHLTISSSFTFAIRFQLLALVLEGTLPPPTMVELIPHVQMICRHYGPELVARGVRKLQYQIPTPRPDVKAQELGIGHIMSTLARNIRDYQVCVRFRAQTSSI